MADRIADIALFVAARAWVAFAALTLVAAAHLATALAAPPKASDSHPERVVVVLPQPS
jgi:hypothetical protein